jgi:hypothetical protein
MSSFGPRWKLGVTGAVVTAGIALILVDWTIARLTVFVATVLVARGALHITTTTLESVPGAPRGCSAAGPSSVPTWGCSSPAPGCSPCSSS